MASYLKVAPFFMHFKIMLFFISPLLIIWHANSHITPSRHTSILNTSEGDDGLCVVYVAAHFVRVLN